MRYKEGHKEETHKRMLEGVSRCFKEHGYAGAGVDALAKESGVTSGAFYKHFKSKSDAFKTVLELGLLEVLEAIKALQAEHEDDWWKAFASVYMDNRRVSPANDGCPLQSLSPEVMRADEDTKAVFEDVAIKIAKAAAQTNSKANTADAWPKLAMLVGGLTLARSVNDKKLSKLIGDSIKKEFED